jgi:hypothetical protein
MKKKQVKMVPATIYFFFNPEGCHYCSKAIFPLLNSEGVT